MLEHGHSPYLIVASFVISLMAGFTGLSLTRGASTMAPAQRKLVVTMSAVALGSGIWSMHYVAMLGMTLPVPFYYDALKTLISALSAILLTGAALLVLHFGPRTPARIALAGCLVGGGIMVMHYVGMDGMQVARPVYTAGGVVMAGVTALVMCTGSFWICYGERTRRNIILGTLAFAVAVVSVHYTAMNSTHFVADPEVEAGVGLGISNEVLAILVTLSSFVISGSFLLVGVTFIGREDPAADTIADPDAAPVAGPEAATSAAVDQAPPPQPDAPPAPRPVAEPEPERPAEPIPARTKIPFEKNGTTHFLPHTEVAALRAEGHYSFIYHASGRLFCPWPISSAEARLAGAGFIRCHRSYLVNVAFVSGFERRKDIGVCLIEQMPQLPGVPVSRSFLKPVRERLGL